MQCLCRNVYYRVSKFKLHNQYKLVRGAKDQNQTTGSSCEDRPAILTIVDTLGLSWTLLGLTTIHRCQIGVLEIRAAAGHRATKSFWTLFENFGSFLRDQWHSESDGLYRFVFLTSHLWEYLRQVTDIPQLNCCNLTTRLWWFSFTIIYTQIVRIETSYSSPLWVGSGIHLAVDRTRTKITGSLFCSERRRRTQVMESSVFWGAPQPRPLQSGDGSGQDITIIDSARTRKSIFFEHQY